jgi:hypothetical protein
LERIGENQPVTDSQQSEEAVTRPKPSKSTAAEPPRVRNSVKVFLRDSNDTADAASARTLTKPEVQAAAAIQKFEGDNHEVNALIRELESQVAKVHTGDLARPEAMLLCQSHTLDEIFYCLVRRSQANMETGYPDACERYMRLALKAQSQSRTTLETLAEIKNPRSVAFVRQANIAHGAQQVNNVPPGHDHAREIFEKQSNEQSRGKHELLPHASSPKAEGGISTPLEAMGEIKRPSHSGGEGQECKE